MMIIMFRCLRFPYKPNFINNSIPHTQREKERTIKCGHIRPSTQPPTHHCRSRKSAVYWVLWVNICFLLFLLHYHPVSFPTSSSSIHPLESSFQSYSYQESLCHSICQVITFIAFNMKLYSIVQFHVHYTGCVKRMLLFGDNCFYYMIKFFGKPKGAGMCPRVQSVKK